MNASLAKLRHRLLQVVAPQRLTWEENFRPRWAVRGHGRFEAGTRTYWFGDADFVAWKHSDSISIGAYCSIASGAVLIAGGNHLVGSVSTYPFSMIDRWKDWNAEPQREQHLVVGNDVWIGSHAMVVGDVTIGDGAVIGAGAVVVRDVPPYAVALGVPARVVRYRFPPEDIETLRALRWWEWPEEAVLEAEPHLRGESVDGLVAFAEERGLWADEPSDPLPVRVGTEEAPLVEPAAPA